MAKKNCEVFNNSKWQPQFFEFSKYLVHFWCDNKLFVMQKLYSQKPAHFYKFKNAGPDIFGLKRGCMAIINFSEVTVAYLCKLCLGSFIII